MYNMTSDLGLPSFEESLEDCVKNNKSPLLTVSGGLDSAYTLWKISNSLPETKIVLQHYNLYKDHSKRWEAEIISLKKQIKYLNHPNTKLYQTEITTGDEYIINDDWHTTAFLSVTRAMRENCSYIIVGDDLPDSYDRAQAHSKINDRKKKCIIHLGSYINNYSYEKVKLCTASQFNNLSELYNEMPDEYIRLAFSCRRPIKSQYFYRACGQCYSCIKNRNFGWWDRTCKELRIE